MAPSIMMMPSAPTPSLDEMIRAYSHKPELLKLILLSKVEEDRRRTEEARLRSKEIEVRYYLLQQQQQQQRQQQDRLLLLPPPILEPPSYQDNASGSLRSLPDILPPLSTQQHGPSPGQKNNIPTDKALENCPAPNKHPVPIQPADDATTKLVQRRRRRRRREMQAITMIIETREFPYNDDYLWKNNGNTIHKGSGTRSIYYKCANNSNGCQVNKTVTFKGNGEYLIKYRGRHLSDCHRIKRVFDR